jgi:hypothetical protein
MFTSPYDGGMAQPGADGSGTPLPKKLGIREGARVYVAGAPESFDAVHRIGLDAGLVDSKSASITEAFQGLQFVYRLKDRPR